jgi:hypothetical protein
MAVVKIKIKSGVIINGKDANPGEVWEVPRYLAQQFCGNGLAEPYVAEGETPPKEENYGVRIETPDNRDPAPRLVPPPPERSDPKDKTKPEKSVPSSPARP